MVGFIRWFQAVDTDDVFVFCFYMDRSLLINPYKLCFYLLKPGRWKTILLILPSLGVRLVVLVIRIDATRLLNVELS